MTLFRRIAQRWPVVFAVGEAAAAGLAAIRAYKVRAGLTILSVVIGVMTVTGMSSIVSGLNTSMAQQIESLGTSVLFVRPFGPTENLTPEELRRRKGLTLAEVTVLEKLPNVAAVSPLELLRADIVKHGRHRIQGAQILGTTPAFETVHDAYIARGRFLSAADVQRAAAVVVIGTEVVDALFPHLDPLEKEVTMDGRRFRVVGVMERKGKFLFESQDNVILVPLGSLQRRDSTFDFLMADVKAASPDRIQQTVDEVSDALRRQRKLRYRDKDDFAVSTQDALSDLYGSITGGIYMMMIAISSIGLVVGGVGVMNIMLVSVTERTREIGLRRALGAKKRDIFWQFLTEAMTLTGAGGGLGIVGGVSLVWITSPFSPFPVSFQPGWMALGLLTSVVVGLFFGLWPASKAANLDPVEALRHE